MVTENFKNLCAMFLSYVSNAGGLMGMVKLKNLTNVTRYKLASVATGIYPFEVSIEPSYNSGSYGISVGTDGTAPTEEDYNLGNTITSGININITEKTHALDSLGNPQLICKITVTNTGNSPITIREIGYKQRLNVAPFSHLKYNTYISEPFMLDRTVLSPALTIEAGDAGIIEYTLKTIAKMPKTISGVAIEPFDSATDENFVAMIQAARQGTIDLHDDCGWRIGDERVVDIGEWVDGLDTSHSAFKAIIVLSSFDEYEGCGNVIQFDFFAIADTYTCKMNSTATTAGGYGASAGRVSCTNLAAAMPQYMKDLMMTFDVKAANTGGGSAEIVTVTDNKLALRSETEITGSATSSKDDGSSQCELYKNGFYRAKNVLASAQGDSYAMNLASYSWLRSPYISSTSAFVGLNNSGAIQSYTATNKYTLVLFGCL